MATITGISKVAQKLDNISNIDLTKTMNKAVALVQRQAKESAPGDTGVLKSSIHMDVQNYGNEIIGTVYTNIEYATFVEFGTGRKGNGTYPYTIKGLRLTYRNTNWSFEDPKTGERIWTSGQEAQPYMYPALKQNEKKIKSMFKEAIQKELSSNCKGG